MKLVDTVIVFDQGAISRDSAGWKTAYKGYSEAVHRMDHPEGSGKFRIRPKEWRKDGEGKSTKQWARNGVKPIKDQFLRRMRQAGWNVESALSLDQYLKSSKAKWLRYPDLVELKESLHSSVGELDFLLRADGERIAIEWETGNISSSHRSMNKLCLALLAGLADVCVLIVPSRAFYNELTDRIGNWQELCPYLAFWRKIGELGVKRGMLVVTIVEHDELVTDDPKFPFIGVGKDGRAEEGRTKYLASLE